MGKWDIRWSDEYLCGNSKIDFAHKFIIEKGTLLHQKLANPPHDEEELYNLAMKIADKIIEHMKVETEWMKEFNVIGYEAHIEDHDMYRSKFDLDKRYDISKKMRLLMVADMVLEYMNFHFFNFDLVDLRNVSQIIKNKHRR
jgi:hemerythrin